MLAGRGTAKLLVPEVVWVRRVGPATAFAHVGRRPFLPSVFKGFSHVTPNQVRDVGGKIRPEPVLGHEQLRDVPTLTVQSDASPLGFIGVRVVQTHAESILDNTGYDNDFLEKSQ